MPVLIGLLAAGWSQRNSWGLGLAAIDTWTLYAQAEVSSVTEAVGVLTEPLRGGRSPGSSLPYWRPVPVATYLIENQLGDPDGTRSSLINLGLHVVVALLTISLGYELLASRVLATFSGVLMGIGPVANEVVPVGARRHDLLVAVFSLAAVLAALRTRGNRRIATAVFLFSAAAVGSKEIGMIVVVPVAIASLGVHGLSRRAVPGILSSVGAVGTMLVVRALIVDERPRPPLHEALQDLPSVAERAAVAWVGTGWPHAVALVVGLCVIAAIAVGWKREQTAGGTPGTLAVLVLCWPASMVLLIALSGRTGNGVWRSFYSAFPIVAVGLVAVVGAVAASMSQVAPTMSHLVRSVALVVPLMAISGILVSSPAVRQVEEWAVANQVLVDLEHDLVAALDGAPDVRHVEIRGRVVRVLPEVEWGARSATVLDAHTVESMLRYRLPGRDIRVSGSDPCRIGVSDDATAHIQMLDDRAVVRWSTRSGRCE